MHHLGPRLRPQAGPAYERTPMYVPDSFIDQLINDDVPSIDLTTHVLGIGGRPGRM